MMISLAACTKQAKQATTENPAPATSSPMTEAPTSTPTEEPVAASGSQSTGTLPFPDWNADFTSDGYIELGHIERYLSDADIAFSYFGGMGNEIHFANEHFMIYVEQPFNQDATTIYVRDLDWGQELLQLDSNQQSIWNSKDTTISRALAERLWIILNIANGFSDMHTLHAEFSTLAETPNAGQTPANSTQDLIAALSKGDYSSIVGDYHSPKYGNATISEDGGIIFANVTDYRGNVYQNLKYMFNATENEGLTNDLQHQGSLPYIWWNYGYVREHSNHTGPDLMYGQGLIYLFPAGVDAAWYDGNGNLTDSAETNTVSIRLYVHGSEHGSGTTGNRLDPREYFIKMDDAYFASLAGDNITPPVENFEKVHLEGFGIFNDIGFTTQQQEIILTDTQRFFIENYPGMKSLTADSGTISYDAANPDLTFINLTSDTGEVFKLKLDAQGSMFKMAVSIYDSSGNLLN
jgi:hypothetical protein